MANPNHTFRETNLVLQLTRESRIKSKIVMSWRKKRVFFVPFILSEGLFFNICVWSQRRVYWINFQIIYNFTNQKALLHKIVESFPCILKYPLRVTEVVEIFCSVLLESTLLFTKHLSKFELILVHPVDNMTARFSFSVYLG